ncbi:MAG: 3-hydroxyacyl-CoA dehydrogenase NAD-binding domain-containing protein [Actinomycetia bacterium]|nr:3-hydroxyacyl-CoA dehydrogenase NAD-binding domain-containing protein [Actinomycetes bacterium]
MEPSLLGVVGAGVIGVSVVQDLAQSGHDVVVVDRDVQTLTAAERTLRRNVRLHHLVAATDAPLDAKEVLGRVRFTTDLADMADRQFIIENVTEDWEIKRAVYVEIDRVCEPACIFAVNTSVIPITKIAAVTARPSNVIGMHFMNPVPLKPVVEVIRGHHTSQETIDAATRLLKQMAKTPIVVNDSPGFVSNRVLMVTINEAAFLVHEGVSTPRDIDTIFRKCFGHAMGPLETADLIGIDTILRSVDMLWAEFKDSKYRPCPLLGTMVNAGLLGRKSGEGFHMYQGSTIIDDSKGK